MKNVHLIMIFIFCSMFVKAENEGNTTTFGSNNLVKLDKISWQEYNTSASAWINSEMEEFEYNMDITTNEITSYIWSLSDGVWLKTEKTASVYEEGNLTQEIKSNFNTALNVWLDSMKKVFVYENNLLKNTIVYERGTNANTWQYSVKEEFEYDASGNKTKSVFMVWDAEASVWENYEQDFYTYDSDNRIITYTSQIWNFLYGGWDNYDKEEYSYSSDPITEDYIYYLWNESTSSWDNYFKDHVEYYNNNLNMGYLSWYWEAGAWKDFTKEVHQFDGNKNLLNFAEYEWNPKSNRWDYYDKETYIYDTENNLIEYIDYDKTILFNQWVEHTKEVYSYNSSVKNDALVLPYSDPDILSLYFKSQLLSTSVFNWDKTSSTWQNSAKGIFEYSDFLTSKLDNKQSSKMNIYPNPFTEFVYFDYGGKTTGAMIEIFDVKGLLVMRKAHNLNNPMNLDHFKKGVYFMRVISDNKLTYTSKLIKQ